MKPEWRTSTVVGICERIRQTQDYSALPILADALQDAGCDDEDLLATLRFPDIPPILAKKVAAVVYSEESASAVQWMEDHVLRINYYTPECYDEDGERVGNTKSDTDPHSFEDVIESGYKMLNGGYCFGSDAGADYFYDGGDAAKREFYRHWSLITGVEVADGQLKSMRYRCAC